jgi:hypothetical protein
MRTIRLSASSASTTRKGSLKTSRRAWPGLGLASIPKRRAHRVRQKGNRRPPRSRSRQAGDVRLPWVHALLRDPAKRQWLRAGKDAGAQADAGQAETNQGVAQGDPPRRRRGARQMACPGASRLVGLLRRADERTGDHGVPSPSGRSLAPRHQAAGTETSARMAANEDDRQSLLAVSAHPASVARTTVSRQSSEVGARCGSAARRDLCGGRPAMAVPTAPLIRDHRDRRPLCEIGTGFRRVFPRHFPSRARERQRMLGMKGSGGKGRGGLIASCAPNAFEP